jgi:orotidine-5'-phosphate decarboxylase
MSNDMFPRIIWSADVATPDDVRARLTQIGHPISVKLDRLFMRRNGSAADELCRAFGQEGIQVFNDAKIIEIPSKVEELAKLEIELNQPWMLNCMAGVLSTGLAVAATEVERDKIDGLKLFADVCKEAGVRSCAVTVLTSKTDEIVHYEFGAEATADQVLYYVERLEWFGFTDIVCSPKEAEMIRLNPKFDHLELNTPGIRRPQDPPDDQGRTMTPSEAVSKGVNRVVIGRPITRSADPRATVESIADDMLSAA